MKVLCVCTGNTCRSPMLMALLRAALKRQGRQDVQVESAGVAATDGESASPHACTCMARRGLDLTGHRSRHVGSCDLTSYDCFLCMSDRHAASLHALGIPATRTEVVNAGRGGVPDPFGGGLDDYEACAQALEAWTLEWVASRFTR